MHTRSHASTGSLKPELQGARAQPLLGLPEPWGELMETAVSRGYHKRLESPLPCPPTPEGDREENNQITRPRGLNQEPLPTCENWRQWLRGGAGSRRKRMELQALGRTPHWSLTIFWAPTWARASSSTSRASARVAKWQSPVAGSKNQFWGRDELHVTGR